jgi:hypothetical protein
MEDHAAREEDQRVQMSDRRAANGLARQQAHRVQAK